MPIAASPNRGRTPSTNAITLLRGVVNIAAGVTFTTPEVVCGVNAGVHLLVWCHQTAGTLGITVTPEFLFRQDIAVGFLNTPQWDSLDNPYVLPIGPVLRREWDHPARRFRFQFAGDAAGIANTLRFHVAAWAV